MASNLTHTYTLSHSLGFLLLGFAASPEPRCWRAGDRCPLETLTCLTSDRSMQACHTSRTDAQTQAKQPAQQHTQKMIRPPVRIDRRRGHAASATAAAAARGNKGPQQQQRPPQGGADCRAARGAGAGGGGGAECRAALAQAQLKLEGARAQLAGFVEGDVVKEAVARRGVLQVRGGRTHMVWRG